MRTKKYSYLASELIKISELGLGDWVTEFLSTTPSSDLLADSIPVDPPETTCCCPPVDKVTNEFVLGLKNCWVPDRVLKDLAVSTNWFWDWAWFEEGSKDWAKFVLVGTKFWKLFVKDWVEGTKVCAVFVTNWLGFKDWPAFTNCVPGFKDWAEFVTNWAGIRFWFELTNCDWAVLGIWKLWPKFLANWAVLKFWLGLTNCVVGTTVLTVGIKDWTGIKLFVACWALETVCVEDWLGVSAPLLKESATLIVGLKEGGWLATTFSVVVVVVCSVGKTKGAEGVLVVVVVVVVVVLVVVVLVAI